MTAFRLNRSWLSRKGSSELEATFCQLSITVDDKNVSEFSDDALPRVQFIPTGRSILVSAKPRLSPLAEVRLRKGGMTSPPREEVERELRKFVEATVERLDQSKISGTGLINNLTPGIEV
jgi:hypothetical protein